MGWGSTGTDWQLSPSPRMRHELLQCWSGREPKSIAGIKLALSRVPSPAPHPSSLFFSSSGPLPSAPWRGPEAVLWEQTGALPAEYLLCPEPGAFCPEPRASKQGRRENTPPAQPAQPHSSSRTWILCTMDGPPAESYLKLFGSSIRSKEAF